MSITIRHTSYTEIYNSQNKLIYKFISGSLLDHIIYDLWPIIITYFLSDLAVGKQNGNYCGYRLVKELERHTPSFKTFIANNYRKNNGLLALDTLTNGVLCNDNCSLAVDGFWIKIDDTSNVSPGQHILFVITKFNEKIVLQKLENIESRNIMSPHHKYDHVGLFVNKDFYFDP